MKGAAGRVGELGKASSAGKKTGWQSLPLPRSRGTLSILSEKQAVRLWLALTRTGPADLGQRQPQPSVPRFVQG